MFSAFLRALGQLTDPPILRLLGGCVMLSVLCFLGAWTGVAWLLASTDLFGWEWLDAVVKVLGAGATLVLTWLLFPLLASLFVGLFLDRAANAVEARHYPSLPPAPGLPFWQGLGCSLRFAVLVIVGNLLLLALWLVPPAYPIGYFAVNGWLLGREYFELVALRRLPPVAARDMRRRHRFGLFTMGVVAAFLMTLPLVNFVAPVVLTAAMVHRFQAFRGSGA